MARVCVYGTGLQRTILSWAFVSRLLNKLSISRPRLSRPKKVDYDRCVSITPNLRSHRV